jgi:tRNA (cytidine56-2'-O)-methyltransferase
LAHRLDAVTREWGGAFRVVGVPDWRAPLARAPGGVVHLTMYGEPLDGALPRLRRRPELLVVVGGPKVPRALFGLADANVAVGSQPHSEVAALAVFLDRLRGLPGDGVFGGARRAIVPDPRAKRVLDLGPAPAS